MLSMEQVDLKGKIALIREDFNVPMANGKITHTIRIDCALPTIKRALEKGARVILLSHLGRPKEGKISPEFSLAPVAEFLSQRLSLNVPLVYLGDPLPWQQSPVILMENVRFLHGEEENSPELSKKLAQLGDVFVMDAFACAHRAQASTAGIANFVDVACAGPLLLQEINAITKALNSPERPIVAIVGGSKVSTKLHVLTNVLNKVDVLVVGGGIANTFLVAEGHEVGESLYEPDCVEIAKNMLLKAKSLGKTIFLPQDVVVAKSMEDQGEVKSIQTVSKDDKIFDIGPESAKKLQDIIQTAKTILWNGPVGVFEKSAFAEGTQKLGDAIQKANAFSVAGGGDTLAAIEAFNIKNISYLSTGGGAFLEMLEGKTLPGVAALIEANKKSISA